MTKIVGHRGVKGLEHENTIRGFLLARSLGVDAIEFDVLATRDGRFVVCHDDNLQKLTGKRQYISRMDYADVAEIHLANGETIPLLYDVLQVLQDVPVVIDIKSDTYLPELLAILDCYPDMDITVTSWLTPWVSTYLKKHRPHIPALIERYYLPFRFMRSIRNRQADGINLRLIWLNPITYYLVRRRGLTMQVYTVNNPWVARYIRRFYPDAWICSNYPHVLKQLL